MANPAAGAANKAVRQSPAELERVTGGAWVDVRVAPQDGAAGSQA